MRLEGAVIFLTTLFAFNTKKLNITKYIRVLNNLLNIITKTYDS